MQYRYELWRFSSHKSRIRALINYRELCKLKCVFWQRLDTEFQCRYLYRRTHLTNPIMHISYKKGVYRPWSFNRCMLNKFILWNNRILSFSVEVQRFRFKIDIGIFCLLISVMFDPTDRNSCRLLQSHGSCGCTLRLWNSLGYQRLYTSRWRKNCFVDRVSSVSDSCRWPLFKVSLCSTHYFNPLWSG